MRALNQLLALGGLAMGLLTTSAANASVYQFVGLGLDITVTTSNTLDAAGGYDITGLSGTLSGYGTVSLITNPNQPNVFTIQNPPFSGGANLSIDNVWYSSDPHLDGNGLAFLTAGGLTGGLWGNSAGNYGLFLGNYDIYIASSSDVTVSAAVPEPSTWAMLILGFASIGFMAYRRRRSTLALRVA